MKLKARVTTITGTAATRSQGDKATALDVLHLLQHDTPTGWPAGAGPDRDSSTPVSARIMAGMDKVAAAMMWLWNEGIMCRKMMRLRLATG